MKRKSTMFFRLRKKQPYRWLFSIAAYSCGCTSESIEGGSRTYAPVAARTLIVNYLSREGLSQVDIGDILNRNRSTVSVMKSAYLTRIRYEKKFAEMAHTFDEMIRRRDAI